MDASVSSFLDCISDFVHHFISLANSKKDLSLIMKKAWRHQDRGKCCPWRWLGEWVEGELDGSCCVALVGFVRWWVAMLDGSCCVRGCLQDKWTKQLYQALWLVAIMQKSNKHTGNSGACHNCHPLLCYYYASRSRGTTRGSQWYKC